MNKNWYNLEVSRDKVEKIKSYMESNFYQYKITDWKSKVRIACYMSSDEFMYFSEALHCEDF